MGLASAARSLSPTLCSIELRGRAADGASGVCSSGTSGATACVAGGTCISFCAWCCTRWLCGSVHRLVQPLMLVGVVSLCPCGPPGAQGVTPVRDSGCGGHGGRAQRVHPLHEHRVVRCSAGDAGRRSFVLGCFVVGLFASGQAQPSFCWPLPARQAAMLGSGAGVMFGATAGLLKLVGTSVTTSWSGLPTTLVVLGMLVAAGLLGTAMNQRAYQLAPISFSMPMVNVVDIMVAVSSGQWSSVSCPPTLSHARPSAVSAGLRGCGSAPDRGHWHRRVDPAPRPIPAGQLR